ncbi:IclR family transcriptional regulator [Nocardioides acrostichi]|uniref:IclR family transcriptional regulator n=1 Tax=Nocardioides acrostichi TaxID=2784339 RepID=A0A930Y8S3_9ACTN|nr:IclR family transcriptional regulator [Nocardioides acrostichi]MBF4163371.1 IclR family transcriptional regulator [Nocardioides acrostichi]
MSQSLRRGLDILGELASGARTLDELAASLGVHKTTVLRLVRTLEEQRFVCRDDQHRCHLGSRLFHVADIGLEQHPIRDVAAIHLRRLARATGGQAVHLAVAEQGHVVYIDKVESTHAVRMYSRIGLPAPLHCTAVGKVLMAALPPRRRDAVVAGLELRSFTPSTITRASALRSQLELVDERGWAEDVAEHEAHVHCIAAPVHDAADRVVAAVSISVPELVLDHAGVVGLLPHLLETTAAIDAEHRA